MLTMLRYQLICIFVVHINKKQGFLTTRLICVYKMKVMNVHIVQTQNESIVSFICCTSISATLKKSWRQTIIINFMKPTKIIKECVSKSMQDIGTLSFYSPRVTVLLLHFDDLPKFKGIQIQ